MHSHKLAQCNLRCMHLCGCECYQHDSQRKQGVLICLLCASVKHIPCLTVCVLATQSLMTDKTAHKPLFPLICAHQAT